MIVGRNIAAIRRASQRMIEPQHEAGGTFPVPFSPATGGQYKTPNNAPVNSLASYIGSLRKALTVKQVAELLAMSPRTVQQWAKMGRLPAIRHGSVTRFDPIQLANWVRENSTSPRLRTN
jgi:excisionase family DNA binding protein